MGGWVLRPTQPPIVSGNENENKGAKLM